MVQAEHYLFFGLIGPVIVALTTKFKINTNKNTRYCILFFPRAYDLIFNLVRI